MSHRHDASDASDSAGVPWAGRSFQPNPAAGDDGSADPVLAAALVAFRLDGESPVVVLEALRHARLLVPLLAEAGELGVAPDGHRVDKTQELSLVTVAGPDGRAVLPAFTDVAAMSRWNPTARPIPAEAARIALAAASEDSLVVLDAGSEAEFVVRTPMLRALATGQDWPMPWLDDGVIAAVQASTRDEAAVAAVDLGPGDPEYRLRGPELAVVVHLRPGLARAELDALIARMQAVWAASAAFSERVDSVGIRLVRED